MYLLILQLHKAQLWRFKKCLCITLLH